ncbi:MAG: hypothetical protein ACJA2K_000105 [Thalassolituus sp.]|jgi:hypothetical protein
MQDDDFEQRLKALSATSGKQSDAHSDERLQRALARAKRDTAYKEGLGFITAIVWVLISGLGLHLYNGVRKRTQNTTPTSNQTSNLVKHKKD